MAEIKIAFWNLQNLFDTTVSDIAADLEFTPEAGWDEVAFRNKLQNLAEVIRLMHRGQGADLLGLCEIENRSVAEQLIAAIGRDDYRLAHVESPDIRGLDTSLVYSAEAFELIGEPVGHLVHLRYPTRDIFEVTLRVRANGAELVVLVNHWPSRRQGTYVSEPFRIAVAHYCGRLVDQLLTLPRDQFLALPDAEESLSLLNDRWNRNVLLMGDFNDEPSDRSLVDYLQASRGEDKLEEKIKPRRGSHLPAPDQYLQSQAYLFNCMWPLLGEKDQGTLYFPDATNPMNLFDQFLVSRGLYYGEQGLQIDLNSVEIFKPEVMASGRKKRPQPFDKRKKSGYSDHFPIQAILRTR